MGDKEITRAELEQKVLALQAQLAETDRNAKTTVKALKQSEEKYRALINTTDTGYVILDMGGCVIDANQEYARLTGHGTVAEILGRNVVEWTAAHDLERNREQVVKCFETGSVRNLEIEYEHPDGTVIPIEINATVVDGGAAPVILTLCRDITERRLTEKAVLRQQEALERTVIDRTRILRDTLHELEENRAQIQSIIDNTSAVIYLKNLDGYYILVNRIYEVLFHVSREDIMAKTDHDIFPRDLADNFRNNDLAVIQTGAPLEIEEQAPHDDGLHTYISLKFLLYDNTGKPYGVCGISTDITERIRAREEKEALMQQLLHSQKMEALGTLAGGIAHDFNNILAAISGTAELMLRSPETPEPFKPRVERIVNSSRRAKSLTMKLLTFARKEKLDVATVSAEKLVADVIDILEGAIPKNIRLHIDCDPDVPDIRVDLNQITQALLNICLNACDAMPDGGALGIRIRESVREPEPGAEPLRFCAIDVSDTGEGIDEDIRNNIFEPFFTTKPRGKGSGLGLSITHGIIQSHAGSIRVQSRKGQGTTITLLLPACQNPSTHASAAPAPDSRAARQLDVLIVDDDADFADTLRENMEMDGCRVTVCPDGPAALEAFQARHAQIDLVILDMLMPDMDGAEVFERLRRIDPGAAVILCSGYSVEGKAGALLAAGARAYLQKPFTLSELNRTLLSVCP